jgi:hypothetical protein
MHDRAGHYPLKKGLDRPLGKGTQGVKDRGKKVEKAGRFGQFFAKIAPDFFAKYI